MSEISKVKINNGGSYGIKDTYGRDVIDKVDERVTEIERKIEAGEIGSGGGGSVDFAIAAGEGENSIIANSISGDNVNHAIGANSFAMGVGTTASEGYVMHSTYSDSIIAPAFSEGYNTLGYGGASHVEGGYTTASGGYSHSANYYTGAMSSCQTVIGKYNVLDSSNTYAFIIGNGTSATRSNAFTVDWEGNLNILGTLIASNSTINLVELSNKVNTIYNALVANGIITE